MIRVMWRAQTGATMITGPVPDSSWQVPSQQKTRHHKETKDA
jgi:hypothetical protein